MRKKFNFLLRYLTDKTIMAALITSFLGLYGVHLASKSQIEDETSIEATTSLVDRINPDRKSKSYYDRATKKGEAIKRSDLDMLKEFVGNIDSARVKYIEAKELEDDLLIKHYYKLIITNLESSEGLRKRFESQNNTQ